jgi:hypothetical protein
MEMNKIGRADCSLEVSLGAIELQAFPEIRGPEPRRSRRHDRHIAA